MSWSTIPSLAFLGHGGNLCLIKIASSHNFRAWAAFRTDLLNLRSRIWIFKLFFYFFSSVLKDFEQQRIQMSSLDNLLQQKRIWIEVCEDFSEACSGGTKLRSLGTLDVTLLVPTCRDSDSCRFMHGRGNGNVPCSVFLFWEMWPQRWSATTPWWPQGKARLGRAELWGWALPTKELGGDPSLIQLATYSYVSYLRMKLLFFGLNLAPTDPVILNLT